jgi:hypothetical protein
MDVLLDITFALLTVVNPGFPACWADDIERHN